MAGPDERCPPTSHPAVPRTLLSREPLAPIKRGGTLSERPPFVIGITGASGGAIAVRAVEALREAGHPVALIVSSGGQAVLDEEVPSGLSRLATAGVDRLDDRDLAAPWASGSRPTAGMAIVPCSGNTLAKVAGGLGDSLLTRAAQVHLKEHRRLVLVPRETPLSAIALGQMAALASLGVRIVMASPAFYLKPKSVEEIVDYLAGKVLEQLGVEHRLYRGWRAAEA